MPCCSEQSLIVSCLGSIEDAMPLVNMEMPARYHKNWAEQGEGLRFCVHHLNLSGIPSQVRPSNTRPVSFLCTPPHCLKKKATPSCRH